MSESLTERQTEILGFVSKGFTNAEIGNMLRLSPGTVKVHVSAIIDRLGVTNRTEASTIWLRDSLSAKLKQITPSEAGHATVVLGHAGDDAIAHLVGQISDMLREREIRAFEMQSTAGEPSGHLSATVLTDNLGADYFAYLAVDDLADERACTVTCRNLRASDEVYAKSYPMPEGDEALVSANISIDLITTIGAGPGQVQVQTRPDPAHELVGRGQFMFDKRTPESLQQAITLFSEALKENPSLTAAQIGLANASSQMAVYLPAMAPFFFANARKAAEAATQSDPTSGQAHGALGYVELFGGWEFAAARESLERSMALAPLNEDGYIWASLYNLFTGDPAKAEEVAMEGVRLNPLSIANFVHVGHVFRGTDRLDEAIDHLSLALDMEPGNLRASVWMALCQADIGNFPVAKAHVSRLLDRYPDSGLINGVMGYVAALAGDQSEASARLVKLQSLRNAPAHSPIYEAIIHVAEGAFDLALQKARESVAQKIPLLLGWKTDPIFLGLKDHPDYEALAEEIGIAPGPGPF